MATEAVFKITKENFSEEVLKSSVPVLVDFWAEWCGPCKMLSPVLDEIARDRGSAVKIAKVNIDEEPDLAAEFRIERIPALLYFKDGKLAHQSAGVPTKSQLVQKLDSLA